MKKTEHVFHTHHYDVIMDFVYRRVDPGDLPPEDPHQRSHHTGHQGLVNVRDQVQDRLRERRHLHTMDRLHGLRQERGRSDFETGRSSFSVGQA